MDTWTYEEAAVILVRVNSSAWRKWVVVWFGIEHVRSSECEAGRSTDLKASASIMCVRGNA